MVTPVRLEIPAMLCITLKNKAGEARSQVAEIRGDDDFLKHGQRIDSQTLLTAAAHVQV